MGQLSGPHVVLWINESNERNKSFNRSASLLTLADRSNALKSSNVAKLTYLQR